MLAYVLIILLALVLLSVYILSTLKDYFYDKERVNMYTKANVVANIVADSSDISTASLTASTRDLFADKPMRLLVLDTQSLVVYDNDADNSLKGKLFIRDTIKEALSGRDFYSVFQTEDHTTSMDVAVPILKNSATVGVVYLRESLTEVESFLSDIQYSMITLSIVVSLVVAILSALLASVVTAPLVRLTHMAEEIADGNFNQRVPVKGKDEIARLGEAFNTMSVKLLDLEEKRRLFVSDASHELKTPLATIKLLSESILQSPDIDPEMVREFLGDMTNEIDRLNRIIERLLALTRSDSQNTKIEFETVDLQKLIDTVIRKLRPLAAEKNIEVEFAAPADEPVEMLLDRDKIYEAVYNIVDNSIKYTGEGGHVTVRLSADVSKTVIEIEDDGIGIPKEDSGHIFDRFYRVDKARARDTGGTGLGLSIAAEAVNMHGGHIEVMSEEGVGSKFIIILPNAGK